MSISTKMKALSDEVRELSGTTTKKSIEIMTNDISNANDEIVEQSELLVQITTALENKASGSSGVELPELNNPAVESDILSGKEAIDGSGNKITGNIETKTSSNLIASGATVTVPAGYYASQSTKTISSGSANTPATTITANPTISVGASGMIEAYVHGSQDVTPTVSAGYVSSGTAGTIIASGYATKQLTTQAAKTITPSTYIQTAVSKGVYTTGDIKVSPIPSNYVIPSGTKTITENGTHNVTSYKSVYVDVASGGSSGGSIETCTVTIANNSDETCDIYGTWFDNGYISSYAKSVADGDIVVGVAVKNSFLIMPHGNYLPGLDFEDTVYWDSVGNPVYLIKLSLDTVGIDI